MLSFIFVSAVARGVRIFAISWGFGMAGRLMAPILRRRCSGLSAIVELAFGFLLARTVGSYR